MGIPADAQQDARETTKLARVTSLAPGRTPRNEAMNSRNFFAELRRRKVYKVGIAYAVVAWVLMQVASQIFPFFEIPNWAVRLVVLLLIIGFPVALILAWAFELTPEGIKRTEDVDAKSSAFKARSLTAIVGEGAEKEAAMPFTATHWSMVLDAQSELRAARAALEKLCRIYWQPIYSFVRRQGIGPEDAEDLTQGFFALLLERKDLNTVRKEKARLRSYLLASLKNFLADEQRRVMAIKRGKKERLIPLDEIREGERIDVDERSDRLTADQIYERRWAFTVLEQVMARLRDEYRSANNLRFFDQMKKMLMDEPGRLSQAQVASEFDMTENAVKQAFYRFRQRYQTLFREEIAHTVAIPSDLEDELRYLITVVRT
jgi:RNA polymerase sigma factor (sigma-70 family)